MEPEEYRVLLAQFDERWKPLVETLAGTGARWGEVTALLVGDVILDARVPYIIIDKAWKRDPNNHFYVDRPKTVRSNREVTIDHRLAKLLRTHTEGKDAGDYLFTDPKGHPVMHRDFFRDAWKPAAAAALATGEIRNRPKIHGLRHSSGSWLIAEGVDLFTIQRRLGHESITTTEQIYGHLSIRSSTAAADAMGRVFRD